MARFHRTIGALHLAALAICAGGWCGSAVASDAVSAGAGSPARSSQRATSFGFPLEHVAPTAWTFNDRFPKLRFHELVLAVHPRTIHPELGDCLFVVERRGKIYRVETDRQPFSASPFLDLTSRLSQSPDTDDNLLGLAFHPDFARRDSAHYGRFFVFYTVGHKGPRRYVLSRFRLAPGKREVDPLTEFVLIEQPVGDRVHVGGCLQFGVDGCLYVSVGDGGNDHDNRENSQRLDRDLFSGILRIDVDCRPESESHPIRIHPMQGRTTGYCIPNGNPFVGVPGILEEFWSLGFRNPHSIAFDGETGRLWVGDVGQDDFEEINLAEAGSNHGWSFREGCRSFDRSRFGGKSPRPVHGRLADPLFHYPHRDLNNCVIGGFVYRGRKNPELHGKYIFADHGSGRLWVLTESRDGGPVAEELLQIPAENGRIASLVPDGSGEILICLWKWNNRDCRIVQLERGPNPRESAVPSRLSQTGLFADVSTLTPHPQLLPYEVNVPFWSDGAVKKRWMFNPPASNGDDASGKIIFHETKPWIFPPGTLFVKHFELARELVDGVRSRRLETRVLVCCGENKVYGVTYKWTEEQDDALLLHGPVEEAIGLPGDTASPPVMNWTYPGPADCLSCHNSSAGQVLGVRTRQSNRDVHDPVTGTGKNQLLLWSDRRLLSPSLSMRRISELPANVDPFDTTKPLELRARSYLDANCSNCHRPGSGVHASFDARGDVSLSAAKLIDDSPLKSLGIHDARLLSAGIPESSVLFTRLASSNSGEMMPPLAHRRPDQQGVSLIAEWIRALPPRRDPPVIAGTFNRSGDITVGSLLEANSGPIVVGNPSLPEAVVLWISWIVAGAAPLLAGLTLHVRRKLHRRIRE